jgi:hypothetical protein
VIDLGLLLLLLLLPLLWMFFWWSKESLFRLAVGSFTFGLFLVFVVVFMPSSFPKGTGEAPIRPWWESEAEFHLLATGWGKEMSLPVSYGFRGSLSSQAWWIRNRPIRLLEFRGRKLNSIDELVREVLALSKDEVATVTVSVPNGDSDLFQLVLGPGQYWETRTEESIRGLFGLWPLGVSVISWKDWETHPSQVMISSIDGKLTLSPWTAKELKLKSDRPIIQGRYGQSEAPLPWLSAAGEIGFRPEWRLWPLNEAQRRDSILLSASAVFLGQAWRMVTQSTFSLIKIGERPNLVPLSWYSLPSKRVFDPSFLLWRVSAFFTALGLCVSFALALHWCLSRKKWGLPIFGLRMASVFLAFLLTLGDLIWWPRFYW